MLSAGFLNFPSLFVIRGVGGVFRGEKKMELQAFYGTAFLIFVLRKPLLYS